MAWVIFIIILLIAGLFTFLVKPNRRRDTSKFERQAYAHRGLYDNNSGIPENSIAAFRRARAHGYGVELDVQLTKDGKAVVFHDDTLKRMCGADGHIYDYTYEELRRFKLIGTEEQIPLFSDVLRELGGVGVVCEVKVARGADYIALCEKTAELIDGYKGNICMESFDPRSVRWFRKNRPNLIRGQLSMNFMKEKGTPFTEKVGMTELLVNVLGRPDFIAFGAEWGDAKPDSFGFKLCRSFKPLLIAWTVQSQESQDKLLKQYDSVIFEGYMAK